MRKIQLKVPALALTAACVVAGCGTLHANESGAGVSAASTTTASTTTASTHTARGLFAYAPSWLRSSCSETGSSGHGAAVVAGYSNSLTCTLRADMPAEVHYYRYATTSDMTAAYDAALASAPSNSPQQPGDCAAGRDEDGTWSTGGSAVGDIACTVGGGKAVNLIWDDPHTNIIAVAFSRHLLPSVLYEFWQSNGASIDGSAGSASTI